MLVRFARDQLRPTFRLKLKNLTGAVYFHSVRHNLALLSLPVQKESF